MSANDRQVGGTHYKLGRQHWDYVQRSLGGRYLEGTITKYIARWRKKNGVEDLNKALHYLEKLIEGCQDSWVLPLRWGFGGATSASVFAEEFARELGAVDQEKAILVNLAAWRGLEDLKDIERLLNTLIAKA